MHIVELIAYHVRVPLRRQIRHASHARTDSENVVIACRLADGTRGFGEGAPRDYVTGETVNTVLELLRQTDWSQLAALEECSDLAAALPLIEGLQLPKPAGDVRDCQTNAARCALELALLDAAGRYWLKPLSHVTSLLAAELYQPRDRVRYSGAITSARGKKATLWAWVHRLYGFKQLKVKIGIAGHDDADRLRRIRKAVGAGMDIRIDANEAFTPENAVRRIQELEPFRISSVEQPLPHEQLASLADLRRQIKTPIMLDESLCSMADAAEAVRLGACDLFNLRLSKCGGFIRSLRLAQLAQQHGLGCQLGCQVGETAILSAAGRHFATSVADLRFLEGSYDSCLLKDNLGKTDITFGYGGRAPALTRPGLGIDVDESALERMTLRKEVLLG